MVIHASQPQSLELKQATLIAQLPTGAHPPMQSSTSGSGGLDVQTQVSHTNTAKKNEAHSSKLLVPNPPPFQIESSLNASMTQDVIPASFSSPKQLPYTSSTLLPPTSNVERDVTSAVPRSHVTQLSIVPPPPRNMDNKTAETLAKQINASFNGRVLHQVSNQNWTHASNRYSKPPSNTVPTARKSSNSSGDFKTSSPNKAEALIKNRKFHEAILNLRSNRLPFMSDAIRKPAMSIQSKRNELDNYLLLGICYMMRDQQENTLACLKRLIHQASSASYAQKSLIWYAAGLTYFENKAYENAEIAFQKCLDCNCKFVDRSELLFRKAMCCKHSRKYAQARSTLEEIKSDPPHPLSTEDIMFQIGHICQLSGLNLRALSTFNSILKNNPNHTSTLRQLAWLKLSEHKNHKRLPENTFRIISTYLDKALAISCDDPRTLYVQCRCSLVRHEFDRAYASIKQALQIDPINPTYWYYYATSCFERNLYLKSLNAYLRVVHLNPAFPNVWINVAKLYQLYNQTEDAILAYKQAQKYETNPQIGNQITWLQKQLNVQIVQKNEKWTAKKARKEAKKFKAHTKTFAEREKKLIQQNLIAATRSAEEMHEEKYQSSDIEQTKAMERCVPSAESVECRSSQRVENKSAALGVRTFFSV